MKRIFTFGAAILISWTVAALVFEANPSNTEAGEKKGATGLWCQECHGEKMEIFNMSRGGRLYDNWMSELEADKPDSTHPSYPKAGKKNGAATWRCKECHGWDYKGVNGAYGKGSHYTGIKGIRRWAERDPDKIVSIIRDKTHQYTNKMISSSAARKLALFVSRGQIDMDKYIDRATRKARGDPSLGARFFHMICAVCHGFDGRNLNFKQMPEVEYVGTVAQKNPWETLHKIRNGQPGVAMIAMGTLSLQAQVDILAYTQILPEN